MPNLTLLLSNSSPSSNLISLTIIKLPSKLLRYFIMTPNVVTSVSEQRYLRREIWIVSTALPRIVSCNDGPCCARAAFQMAGSLENTGISVEIPIAQACRIIFRRSETTKWVANGQTGSWRVQTDINVIGYLNNKVMPCPGINVLLW